ncbi:sensor histidine kinase YesM [Parabacteroides sp. PF5-5]|uniref:sensor histidine kinase n=1 Tax=unclassified Parabacteroides TaxID=2649774 RepID=UPI002476827F|nr:MULTISPECIES: histidine kinase [unclassified Parabacteroides]MDH6303693.1 sensor histidine kinase YesM [Parabacteroides sp. PH5-39]MDH6314310.1 sensor histidine kinase YesM [Parabacteroides sp. PF5-13]MDH6318626.1 sensor histidine kinase YesM [Parabacteroides sp. PH5-13]MDH6322082.1 sensor histidine kinase YesM [Parabacteroides sp. PH5-8]MDH6325839.1 sensor histidine kinase YesM [Parabacteroides sp. PH5-41]
MKDAGNKYGNKYKLSLAIISVGVSILIHIPEVIDLLGKFENHNVFPGIQALEVVNEIIFSFLALLFLFWLNTVVFHFNKTTAKIGWKNLVLSFLTCWMASTILSNIFYHLHKSFDILAVQSTVHHYLHPIRDFIISGVVTGSCYIIYITRRQQKILLENQQLKLENILSQYESLKSQLNPHMLFNSLNTLRSLIREAPVKAQNYTQELSNVLRYMLQENDSQKTTLAEELEFIEGFTFLLEMRYEDTLIFEIETDKRFNSYLLPPMSLQVLVENAVKHNEISSRHPLKVSIKTSEDGMLHVCNRIQPKLTNSTGTGIGLDNLVKRYQLLFDKEVIIDNTDNLFCVSIHLIKPDNNHENTDN